MFRATSLLTCVFVLAGCLIVVAPQSYAATVFSDGSENSAVGVIPGTGDPTVGNWDFAGNASGSVVLTRTGATTDGPSAAFSGNNYLQIGRGPTNEVAYVGAVFDSPVDVTTTSLHAEFRAFLKQDVTNGVAFSFQGTFQQPVWEPQGNVLVPLIFGDQEGIAQTNLWYWDGSAFLKTTAALTDNAWNMVTIDWDHITDKFTVGINGVSWEAPTVWGTATSISRLEIFPSWNKGNIFLDDVLVQAIPEPASIILSSIGAIGLLAHARRRRRAKGWMTMLRRSVH